MGYSTDNRDALARTAIEKGYKPEFLEKTGLCYRKDDGTLRDRFWGRVIFPVHTLSGKVVAFGGRVLNAATKNVQMKYVNSPESEIYHKSRELYGIYFAKQAMVRQDRCFLVEGYTDVISMHQSGIENVVASSGTALTSDQIRLIHRFTNNITVLYDGDGAGIKASIRGIDMLLEEGMNVKVCLLPDGDDPDSFARKHNATEYQAYINDHEVDFIRFKTDLLIEEAGKDPIKKANLITSIVKSISVIPDSITRNVYIRECSEMLRMEERVLVNAVGKLKEQADENRKKEEQRKEYRARLQAEQQATQQAAVSTPPANAEVSGALASLSGADAPMESPLPGDELPPMPEEGSAEPSYPPVPVEDDYISFIPSEGNEEKLFYKQEVDLMRMLIRYGEKVMCMAEDEEGNEIPVTVAEYIAEGLHNDSLGFHIALHRRVLNECVAHIHDSGFCAERYFVSHLDPEVSKLAAEMASDRYVLSKYHSRGQKIVTDEERLYELIPRLLVDFKLNIVTAELDHILKALTANPDVSRDTKSAAEIMQRYKQLHEVRIVLARHAGDRVVLRY